MPFDRVKVLGLTLPGVDASTKYDGSPVLKRGGAFMAGLATHASAEAETLVVRTTAEDRENLLAEAPDTYYITDYYRPHPVVLARLGAPGPRRAARSAVGVVAPDIGEGTTLNRVRQRCGAGAASRAES